MTFGSKIRALRESRGMTQDDLAAALYVTRTAVSKWENDRGYPNIDSLKTLANFFGVSLDELLSDGDVDNSRMLQEKTAKKFYAAAVCFLLSAVIFSLLARFVDEYCIIGAVASVAGYLVCALLSRPAYKRAADREKTAYYVVSRIIIAAVILTAAVTAVMQTI